MAKLENVCRLCLAEEPDLYLFDVALCLVAKIEAFCSFKIDEDDEMPRYICGQCSRLVEVVMDFKSRCESSQLVLRERLWSMVKIEGDDSMTVEDVPIVKFEQFEPVLEIQDDTKNGSLDLSIKSTRSNPYQPSDEHCDRIKIEDTFSDPLRLRMQNEHIQLQSDLMQAPQPCKSNYNKSKTCPFCSQTFTQTDPFENHLRTHSEMPFECDICHKTFSSRKYLIGHMINHKKSKQCEICGVVLRNLYGLQKHVKYVHKRVAPMKCKICAAIFYRSDNLKAHLRAHKGAKAFECDVCHRRFTLKSTKVCHMRTHTGEKPYTCKYCDARFSRSNTLMNHMKLHTGDTTHHCIFCYRGFIRLSDLKMHLRNKHGELEIR